MTNIQAAIQAAATARADRYQAEFARAFPGCPQLIGQHGNEFAPSYRRVLNDDNIACAEVIGPRDYNRGFNRVSVSVYSYVSPKNGRTLYVIEVDYFVPPDAMWTASYILDGQPSDDQIDYVVNTAGMPSATQADA